MAATKNTMKAIVAYGTGDNRIEELPIPIADEGEIIVKVEACGICAGDLKAYLGYGYMGKQVNLPAPVIPGHEFVGTVFEIGANFEGDLKIGDRVTADQIVPCWKCKNCLLGKYSQCLRHHLFGFRINGGMAEYMRFPKESIIHKVPKEIPTESAVLIEPYACAKHAVDRANICNEDIVVLSGAGTLGLGMLGAIKLKNPKMTIVLDFKEKRLNLAKEFGADIIINPSEEDAVAKVMELSDGIGCDVYIEAAGFSSSVEQGLNMIKRMGTFVEFGVFKDSTSINWTVIGDNKELNIFGSHLGPYCYKPVIEWISNGKMPTKGVVTHKFKLEEWKEAYDAAQRSDESLKVIFVP